MRILYAVVGRPPGGPTLYHLRDQRPEAERLRVVRERADGKRYHVLPYAAWRVDPEGALREAEAATGPGHADHRC